MLNNTIVKNFVESNSNLIRKKETSIEGVYVLKYHNRCFYNGIWNEVIQNCRGAVVDSNYNLIVNPFTKIYNYGIEKEAPHIDDNERVIAIRKVNGFLLAVSWYNDDFIFSTTGSIDSDYAKMGEEIFYNSLTPEMIETVKESAQSNNTLLYEIVHPNDPHIIPEDTGAYFLGLRKNEWNSKLYPSNEFNSMLGKAVESHRIEFGDLKKSLKDCQTEGYVIYCDDGRATKIKSPYYLVKKFLARCTKTEKLLHKDVKKRIAEEYYPLVDYVQNNLEYFIKLSEQDRLAYIRGFLSN